MAPGAKPAVQRRSQETRDKIVDALDSLLKEKDFEAISVTEIAQRASVSPASIYQRFSNRDAAVAILLELYMRRVAEWAKSEAGGGAQIHVTNREKFRPFKTGVAVLKAIHDTYPRDFAWKQPPYEYEETKLPIDILAGTDRLRRDIDAGSDLDEMENWWNKESQQFEKIRKKHLIYK